MSIFSLQLTVFLAVPDAQDVKIAILYRVGHDVVTADQFPHARQLFNLDAQGRLVHKMTDGLEQPLADPAGGAGVFEGNELPQALQVPLGAPGKLVGSWFRQNLLVLCAPALQPFQDLIT